MSTYVQLRRRADRLFHEGESMAALRVYLRLLEVHPQDHAICLHVGDALARLGLRKRAAQVYAAVALGHLRSGRPLQGVAACCALRSVEPSARDVVATLAKLYGRGSGRVNESARPPAPAAPPTDPFEEDVEPVPPAEALHAVLALATHVDAEEEPRDLSPLPILSDLDETDLASVLSEVTRVRLPEGDALMRQGEAGDAFYLLAHGGVRVTRKDDGKERALAILAPGAILGEIALVTRSPRSATVTAVGDVDAIAVPVRALGRIAGDHRAVAAALDRFTRERLLRTAVTGSRIFQPFLPDRLGDVLPLFESRDFAAGEELITEGQPGVGLHVILSGACQVTRDDDGLEMELSRVGPGDIVGELSLLGDKPATATVSADGPTLSLFLDSSSFDELVEESPEVREYLEELGAQREDNDLVNAYVVDDEGFLDPDLIVEEEDEEEICL